MKKFIATLAVLLPSIAAAQAPVYDADSLAVKLTSLGNTAIGILISLAVIYIIWTAVRFAMAGEGEARTALRGQIVWGVIGLAIILSIWGLVAILTNTFNTQNQAPIQDFPVNPYPPVVR